MLAKVKPAYATRPFVTVLVIPRGSYLDATYREREAAIACRSDDRRAQALAIRYHGVDYFDHSAPLQALGIGWS